MMMSTEGLSRKFQSFCCLLRLLTFPAHIHLTETKRDTRKKCQKIKMLIYDFQFRARERYGIFESCPEGPKKGWRQIAWYSELSRWYTPQQSQSLSLNCYPTLFPFPRFCRSPFALFLLLPCLSSSSSSSSKHQISSPSHFSAPIGRTSIKPFIEESGQKGHGKNVPIKILWVFWDYDSDRELTFTTLLSSVNGSHALFGKRRSFSVHVFTVLCSSIDNFPIAAAAAACHWSSERQTPKKTERSRMGNGRNSTRIVMALRKEEKKVANERALLQRVEVISQELQEVVSQCFNRANI